jgi:hypothetical protein
MPDQRSKLLTEAHWLMTEDYINGMNLRDIELKYRVTDRTIREAAKFVGIELRPAGFASYTIAHKWVLQARLDYDRLSEEKRIDYEKA